MKKVSMISGTVVIFVLLVFLRAENRQDLRYRDSVIQKNFARETVKVNPDFGKIPLYFIPNQGQVNENALFYAKTSRYTLWMTKEGLVFDSTIKEKLKRKKEKVEKLKLNTQNSKLKTGIHRDVSRLMFIGANKNPEISAVDTTQHRVNYFIGKEKSQWHTNIPTSRAVLYKNIYNNIDLKVYGIEKQIEYDWIVKPGGNPENIRFEYKNVKRTRIDKYGNLLIETDFRELIHKSPVSYQVTDELRGREIERVRGGDDHEKKNLKLNTQNSKFEGSTQKQTINVAFKKINKNTYGFNVGEYDKTKDLIIDPVVTLEYSTYLGGGGMDDARNIVVDSSGNAYITGYTWSTSFPKKNPFQGTLKGENDVFVTKLSSTGNSLVYSTFLGGNSYDYGYAIKVDSNGSAYVTGNTCSTDFPTKNPYQKVHGGGEDDCFVTKLSPAGNSLVFSTFLGGSDDEEGNGIELDQDKNVYVCGYTESTDFPTKNPYQSSLKGSRDAFITKLSTTGKSLIYSTYLGGGGVDFAHGISLDVYRHAYVYGYTASLDFSTKNPYQGIYGGGYHDGFVTKLSLNGNSLLYSTFLGGSAIDLCIDIVLDSSGNVYVTGQTNSTDFPTSNAIQNSLHGPLDAFVSKISSSGNTLVYSTYLGGTDWDKGTGIAVDSSKNVYVVGHTGSKDFPIKNACQSTYRGNWDAYVTKLSSTGKTIIFSTYLGGKGHDGEDVISYEKLFGIAVDKSGNAYITGRTSSTDFPTKNPYQGVFGGYSDVFISKLSFSSATGSITVTCPNGGESFVVGSKRNITWTSSGSIANVKIKYSINNGSNWTTITSSTANDGSYSWTVPNKLSSSCLVRISDSSNSSISDKSNSVFSIVSSSGSPTITLSRTQMSFGYAKGGSVPGSQTLYISGTGGLLHWQATTDVSWLKLTPSVGTGSSAVKVSIDPSGLAIGTHTGTVNVTDPGATNSPQLVDVSLTVYPPGTTSPPFGEFATPLDGSTVSSSIAVTGWVLDDVEVVSVKIYNGSNYVGDAVFVEGARTDIETAYPGYPKNYQAGWGYMLLTNFLPGGGNGTYTLKAKAIDLEGHQVTLGTKTITCDNAHAVKPFGAIDTPTQGGTASGSSFVNWGWVLTPQPNSIPTDGSTIDVFVDSINLGHPTYNMYRADIATLFPGYVNSSGAVGQFSLDTTAYTNGIHTIYWIATDSGGDADGIGSRYFTIQNSGSSRSGSKIAGNTQWKPIVSIKELSNLPFNYFKPIKIKKGYGRNIQSKIMQSGVENRLRIAIRELEQIECHIPNVETGYLIAGNKVHPLPVGSKLYTKNGLFRWIPGPGFYGDYRLVFVVKDQNGALSKIEIIVNIFPKFGINK